VASTATPRDALEEASQSASSSSSSSSLIAPNAPLFFGLPRFLGVTSAGMIVGPASSTVGSVGGGASSEGTWSVGIS
jgi:hypothetical protein